MKQTNFSGSSRLALAVLVFAWATSASPLAHAEAATEAVDDASRYIVFVEEFAGRCTSRNGVQILVKSSHPSRKIKVWLDRFYMNVGTGDRSRSELAPGGEPEALGCSRSLNGVQEWRIARAQFLD